MHIAKGLGHGLKLGTRQEQELGLGAANEVRRCVNAAVGQTQEIQSAVRRARSSLRGPESVNRCLKQC